MELRDHLFTLDAGEVVREGKSHYPDLVRLRIPKDLALEFAMEVLTRLKNARTDNEDPYLFEIAMFGRLEELSDA